MGVNAVLLGGGSYGIYVVVRGRIEEWFEIGRTENVRNLSHRFTHN